MSAFADTMYDLIIDTEVFQLPRANSNAILLSLWVDNTSIYHEVPVTLLKIYQPC